MLCQVPLQIYSLVYMQLNYILNNLVVLKHLVNALLQPILGPTDIFTSILEHFLGCPLLDQRFSSYVSRPHCGHVATKLKVAKYRCYKRFASLRRKGVA